MGASWDLVLSLRLSAAGCGSGCPVVPLLTACQGPLGRSAERPPAAPLCRWPGCPPAPGRWLSPRERVGEGGEAPTPPHPGVRGLPTGQVVLAPTPTLVPLVFHFVIEGRGGGGLNLRSSGRSPSPGHTVRAGPQGTWPGQLLHTVRPQGAWPRAAQGKREVCLLPVGLVSCPLPHPYPRPRRGRGGGAVSAGP